MNKYIAIQLLLGIIIQSITPHAKGQESAVQEVLNQIKQNNLEIKAQQQWLAHQRMALKTGINPENPTLEYGYFPGNTPAIGVKETFGVTQSFLFPGVYATRYKLADQQIRRAEVTVKKSTQDVLLNAQLSFYTLVYLTKMQHEVSKRHHHASSLLTSYQAKFDQGQVSVLDLNKAKIQALSQENEYILNKQRIQNVLDKLTILNGGGMVSISDSSYARLQPIPFDSLVQLVDTQHPEMLLASLEIAQANLETKEARQVWLPQFEAGYESEAVATEVFRGVKAGISIPLWRDKNKVSAARANESYAQVLAISRKNKVLSELKNQRKQLETLKATLSEYEQTINEVDNIRLLDKALKLGEISVVEYFTELAFYYEIVDEYLSLEFEYYSLLAKYNNFLL